MSKMQSQTLAVLAGGFGTRLNEVINSLPKALAPIGSTPFLEIQMRNWKQQGIKSFLFLLHHQANQIIDFLHRAKGSFCSDCNIDWVVESKPLGTGGSVVHGLKMFGLQGDFLLTNADTWLDSNFELLGASTSPSILVVKVPNCSRYGSIEFDASKKVLQVREKQEIAQAGWINAGLYHLNSELFRNFDESPMSLERELFPTLVERGALNVVCGTGKFLDIGVPDDYFKFCDYAKSKGLSHA
jgi:D-glycero-alpha-D-manno-heptose 1-phosphate guanylyltransferase